MNTMTSAKKSSFFSNKWVKITAIAFLSLYLIIWAISSPLSKHFIKPILLEQGLALSDDTSIRYNPFLSQLTVSDLTLTKTQQGQQETVLSVNSLAVRLTLFRLLFDKIVVSKFELTDAYIKIDKTPTQLIIAGVDLNKDSSAKQANNTDTTTETEAEPQTEPFLYELILPKLLLSRVNIDINNDNKLHDINIQELLISEIKADLQSQQATLSLQSEIDKTAVELSAVANFNQGQGEVSSELSITNYPVQTLQPYLAQLSALSGSLSFASTQQITISPDLFKLHISEAKLNNDDLIVASQQQFFNLEALEHTFNDLTLAFSQGEITELSGTSQITLNKANLYYEKPSQKLAYFEQLLLNDISFHFIDEPQVKISSVVMNDFYGSKNEENEHPPIVTLKEFKISDILASEKQLFIDKITLDTLQSNVIISKEKAVANLVSLPMSQEKTETSKQPNEKVEAPSEINEEATAQKSEFVIALNEFSLINDNQISLLDNSVEPIKKRQLFIDVLSLGAISNAIDKQNEQTPFSLVGRANQYAHFNFQGFTQPFAEQQIHHIQGALKELSLPPLSSYMKQAMQMELKSGQLNTDIDVTLTGEQLKGNVAILLQGLETAIADSNEAGALIDQGALPFNMALGMLKDNKGNVELDVPLSGSTSDPSFGVSSIVTLITQKAIWMATKNYVMTTFVPYANIVSVAMTVGEFALKLRFDDLIYQPKQIEPNDAQKAYLDAFIALMQHKEDTRVNICAISTPSDIGLATTSKVTDKEQIAQLKEIAEQREITFKDYMIKNGGISSSRLLLCAPKIDSSENAQPRIALTV